MENPGALSRVEKQLTTAQFSSRPDPGSRLSGSQEDPNPDLSRGFTQAHRAIEKPTLRNVFSHINWELDGIWYQGSLKVTASPS